MACDERAASGGRKPIFLVGEHFSRPEPSIASFREPSSCCVTRPLLKNYSDQKRKDEREEIANAAAYSQHASTATESTQNEMKAFLVLKFCSHTEPLFRMDHALQSPSSMRFSNSNSAKLRSLNSLVRESRYKILGQSIVSLSVTFSPDQRATRYSALRAPAGFCSSQSTVSAYLFSRASGLSSKHSL